MPSEAVQSYSFGSDFVNMLLTLGFILAMVGVSVWFLKRLMRSRLKNLNQTAGIRILERRSLGPKSSLYLVDILGKGVVISESPAGIQTISEFTEGTNIALLLEEAQELAEPRPSFKENLKRLVKRHEPS